MAETNLNPYLTFDGTTREAMELYQRVLGGTLDMQTFGESPVDAPEDQKDRVMHARLDAEGFTLMASDSQLEHPVGSGENVSLSLQGTDRDHLMSVFDGLAEGGQVTMPLEDQFWGDTFGMLRDRYGINWMVNIAKSG